MMEAQRREFAGAKAKASAQGLIAEAMRQKGLTLETAADKCSMPDQVGMDQLYDAAAARRDRPRREPSE